MNRKEFLKSLIRYVLLAILAVTTYFLLSGERKSSAVSCAGGSLCGACGKSGGCNLPQRI